MAKKKSGGELVREARKARLWSQWDLAVKLRTTQAMVSYYETGERFPGRTKAVALQKVLGIPIDVWPA